MMKSRSNNSPPTRAKSPARKTQNSERGSAYSQKPQEGQYRQKYGEGSKESFGDRSNRGGERKFSSDRNKFSTDKPRFSNSNRSTRSSSTSYSSSPRREGAFNLRLEREQSKYNYSSSPQNSGEIPMKSAGRGGFKNGSRNDSRGEFRSPRPRDDSAHSFSDRSSSRFANKFSNEGGEINAGYHRNSSRSAPRRENFSDKPRGEYAGRTNYRSDKSTEGDKKSKYVAKTNDSWSRSSSALSYSRRENSGERNGFRSPRKAVEGYSEQSRSRTSSSPRSRTSSRSSESGASRDGRSRPRSASFADSPISRATPRAGFGRPTRHNSATDEYTNRERFEDGDRIQKALANLGMGSRREIEQWISNETILVNGKVAKLGDSLQVGDKIEILQNKIRPITDGEKPKRLSINSRRNRQANKWFIYRPKANLPRVLLYHKPEGEIVSRNDPQGRPSVFEKLPKIRDGKWINIGRLDFQTSGLLLFTDNGELANKLMHPSSNLEREYAVRVAGILGENHFKQLLEGIELEDGLAKCEEVKPMSAKDEGRNRWYKMIITEGRNREIRKMIEALELQVSRLMRVRYGPVVLPRSVRRGHYLELTVTETEKLLASLPN